jgi:hypothetical protein
MSTDVTPLEQAHRADLARLLSFTDLDARTAPTRKVHELARRLARDLGGDLSTAKQALVVRAATLIALCEHSEVCLLTGREVSLADYLAATATLKRVLTTLGLDRVPREVTPGLREYLDAHHNSDEVAP